MALSNLTACKRTLYDGLRAALDDTIGVWHSEPNTDHQGNDNLIIGPADTPARFTQEWRGLGGNAPRTESLDIPVRIEVFRGGTDEFEAEDAVWEHAAAIATLLATKPFGTVIYEAHPDQGELSNEPFADGRLVRLNLLVHCTGTVR